MHVSDYFSKIISFGLWLPAVQPCNWAGFRISLSREGAIFRDEIENYFSCSHLARRDRDYHMTILVFRDENEITYCYSRVSRRDRDFTKSFLMVEREKMKLTLTRIPGIENSRWALIWDPTLFWKNPTCYSLLDTQCKDKTTFTFTHSLTSKRINIRLWKKRKMTNEKPAS